MSPRSTTFRGFPAEAFEFYEGLEADNSKSYWQTHRSHYESSVAEPMQQLLAAMPEAYQPFHVFRPYRDVRFSKDKSPYKTQHGAASQTEGGAVHYLHVSAEGVLVAVGMYQLARAQLQRYRAAVADELAGAELSRLVDDVRRAQLTVGPGHDQPLRTVPRGYSPDHPNIELLRWKGCIAATTITAPSVLGSGRLRRRVLDIWERSAPMVAWLETHVGITDEPPESRR